MNLDKIDKWILPLTGTISAVVVAILYSFSKLREMNAIQSKELVLTLKEELSVQKSKVERLTEENRTLKESHQIQLNELNKQIGELSGRLSELSKQNELYLNILKGKNPEQEKVLKEIRDLMKSLNDKAITNQKMALTSQHRDEMIDERIKIKSSK